MKKLFTILALSLICVLCAIGFVACDDNNASVPETEMQKVYNLYVAYAEENGLTTISYEEWLATIKGAQGIQGEKGDQGIQGDKGDKVDTGAQGIQGEKGDKGDTGVGVKSVEIDENGDLIITLTNDAKINAGKIVDNDNPQGFEYFLLADDTYAVDLGHARYLSSVTIPKQYKGKDIAVIAGIYKHNDDYYPSERKLYYEGSLNDWIKLKKDDGDVMNHYEIYVGGESLSDITELILQDVTTLSNYAFSSFTNLKTVFISDSVKEISKWAFSGCESLKQIMVSENNANYSAQDGIIYNKAKTEIICVTKAVSENLTLPNSLTSIGYQAFYGCSSLTSINYNGTMEQWNKISKAFDWKYNSAIKQIICTDGTIEL